METGCLEGRPEKESSEQFSSSSMGWLCYCDYMLEVCVHVCARRVFSSFHLFYFFTFPLLSLLSQPFTHTRTQMPSLLPFVSSHVLCVQLFSV